METVVPKRRLGQLESVTGPSTGAPEPIRDSPYFQPNENASIVLGYFSYRLNVLLIEVHVVPSASGEEMVS